MVEGRRLSTLKTHLQIDIVDRQQKEGTIYFSVQISKLYKLKESQVVEKRYSHFFDLHASLLTRGFEGLPEFPQKKVYLTQ